MARIFITGSADGLGQLAAKLMVEQGHQVVLHARNAERARYALSQVPGAENVLTGDLADMADTKKLAGEVNVLGTFDAVIHNAGVYQVPGKVIFTVNTLAPYILTSLIQKPKRLVYLSSGMHLQGHPRLENLTQSSLSYSDSKLHVLMLAMAVARKWQGVYSNTVDPGWVPTKMGGHGAPDNLQQGYETQVWLATSNDDSAKVTGRYFYHKKEARHRPEAHDVALQEKFIEQCGKITGVSFQQ
jgi:NAD(P)-dependent dehydrogenase (short-subunit alcohol dehydrogenase family)